MFCNHLAIKNNNKPWPCVTKPFTIVSDTMAQKVANILVYDEKLIVLIIDCKLIKTFSS